MVHAGHMVEGDQFEWRLESKDHTLILRWHKVGHVEWSGGVALFPKLPEEPGVYLIKVELAGRYRIYIGEAQNLRKRLRRYGGQGMERPITPDKTTSNMRARVRHTFNVGGSADVYRLELPIGQAFGLPELEPSRKSSRIMLERIAIVAAYLQGAPLINEGGFPGIIDEDDPLR